jgi:RsiW-degrading membrane proteinase PrsW (M82 family)
MSEEFVREPAPSLSSTTGTSIWLSAALVIAAIGGGWLAVTIAILPGLDGESALWLLLFLVAPFYEEALKPLGVYFAFVRWPHVALSRVQIASLAAIGGLTFGLIESYLFVDGHPEEGSNYVLFRFTAPVLMHVTASFIMGLGLRREAFSRPWRISFATREAYYTAVGVHLAYNIAVVVLAVIGVRELVERPS